MKDVGLGSLVLISHNFKSGMPVFQGLMSNNLQAKGLLLLRYYGVFCLTGLYTDQVKISFFIYDIFERFVLLNPISCHHIILCVLANLNDRLTHLIFLTVWSFITARHLGYNNVHVQWVMLSWEVIIDKMACALYTGRLTWDASFVSFTHELTGCHTYHAELCTLLDSGLHVLCPETKS